MNKEQFDRAVAISDRIRELNETKEEIRKKSEVKLTYAYRSDGGYRTEPDWAMQPIAKILDKYDAIIRQEIDDEIEKLTKEVEAL